MGSGSILQERRHSQLEDITAENGAWPHLFWGPRSPLLRRETMPAQPFSRFFHHTAFTEQVQRLITEIVIENGACPHFSMILPSISEKEMLAINKEGVDFIGIFFIKESHL